MSTDHRINNEAGFILHTYPFKETSVVAEVFTRAHGRVALIARGARRPASVLRGLMQPFTPLLLSWFGKSELKTLHGAEWQGGHVMPTGDALLSGYYLNELLMRLLARDDPHPVLFDAYAATVQLIASQSLDTPQTTLQIALRAFELRLLRDIGLLPMLDAETATLEPLSPQTRYVLVAEAGLRRADGDDRTSLPGAQWQALQQTLGENALFSDTVRACIPGMNELKAQLRALLHYHCGVKVLKTRQMMIDLQAF